MMLSIKLATKLATKSRSPQKPGSAYLVRTSLNGKHPHPPSAAGRNVLRTGLSRVRAGLKRERVSLGWLLGGACPAVPAYAGRATTTQTAQDHARSV